jgi:hypothetical protein
MKSAVKVGGLVTLHLGMKLTLTYTDSYFYVTTIINMQPHIE